MSNKIVVFGAGATGRGHVGLLAWQAGFEIVFVDINQDLCATLQDAGRYLVKVFGDGCEQIEVTGFRVYHSQQREAIAREIADAALVLTAVFDQNLPDVAQTLALAAGTCLQAQRSTPLNLVACENMMDSSSALGSHVRSHLQGEDLAYCDKFFGFPDCMISRVVPRPEPDPLVILTEDYNEWTARADAFKGDKPAALAALELVDNQTARLERKLMIHNGGHAICGYMGFHQGHRYVHEAVADPVVARHVMAALDEIGEVIIRKHGFSKESIEQYKQDLPRRGSIAELRDDILRVVRDPIRKLSPRERLVAPAMLAIEHGLPFDAIAHGIVAALKYEHPSDEQSCQLQSMLRQDGLERTLEQICSIPAGSPLAEAIRYGWQNWPETLNR